MITLCIACEEIGPTNSFDPQAPTDIKSLGIVRGRVVLPDLVNANTLLTQVRIELRRLAELDIPFLDAMREDQGRFSFSDLAEDRYQLQISLESMKINEKSIKINETQLKSMKNQSKGIKNGFPDDWPAGLPYVRSHMVKYGMAW